MTNTEGSPASPLTRKASQPLAQQLAQRFAERIQQRLLLPGARLPSVRECARHHGVSPYTVVAAYDQLLAGGLLEARKQRGFFVRDKHVSTSTWQAKAQPQQPVPVDATALIRGMFQADAKRAPGLGTLPAEWLDLPMLQGAMRQVLKAGSGSEELALHYGEPAGDARLRKALGLRLADLGIPCPPEQIVTTVGATHALDLITRTVLQPGDAVLVDDPGWAIEFARLTHAGMRLLPVPRGANGPDLAVMERLIEQHRPRMYVTVSVLHNPTGNSLSLANAHQILKLAEQGDFQIVEDDTYAFLAPNHAPRLSALDGLRRTIYVSGFSKILTPAWRVGYLAASPAWVDKLTNLKLLSSLTTSPLLERAVAHCLEQGQLRRHAERVLTLLDAARQRSMKLAEAAGCRFVAPPQGLFGWVDVGMDTEKLAQIMMDEGWLTAPGMLFSASRQSSTLMRINFATAQDAQFWRRLQTLRSAAV
ncbi:PLP-dependent aminotransferase family protein [Paucibacter sp. B2R-40]|uniref:aminotransferase-like domain-containing protein n=1 Tax=Paucibacter sp. B2R-40 TaxID=2893554 RepID=UPI0021E4B481|nr:PLP-dependent aminotransferase family protein [Paucibacter sp. B2R-40]MCV2353203.1 PLP-dependent aminotransferase family protein [Paucibacter sp. B2R-40]